MVLLLLVSLLGADAAPAAPPAQPTAKVKKICREGPPTGSILPSRICRTAEEWAQMDEQNRNNADRVIEDRNDMRSLPVSRN